MLYRFCYALCIPVGVATLFPNVMIGDSGTKRARHLAIVGVGASILFICAGITGILHNPFMQIGIAHTLAISGVLSQGYVFLRMILAEMP